MENVEVSLKKKVKASIPYSIATLHRSPPLLCTPPPSLRFVFPLLYALLLPRLTEKRREFRACTQALSSVQLCSIAGLSSILPLRLSAPFETPSPFSQDTFSLPLPVSPTASGLCSLKVSVLERGRFFPLLSELSQPRSWRRSSPRTFSPETVDSSHPEFCLSSTRAHAATIDVSQLLCTS